MRVRVLAAVCLTALSAVTLSCGSKGSQKEILVGEYGSLTGGIATFGISTKNGSSSPSRRSTPKGGVLGKKIKLLVEDDQSKPEEAGNGRQQAHPPGPRRRDARPRRLVPLARRGAHLPGGEDPDDLALLDQPARDAGRRLHLPRLLHSTPSRARSWPSSPTTP